jgi:mannose-6-phosphate isomerase-like protein (cupin superfamily)
MASAGDVIENPVTGERITFLKTSRETNGALVEMELSVRPHGFVVAAHVHRRQDETFRVLAGSLSFRLGDRELAAGAGEEVVIPAGVLHSWWNGGDEEARALLTLRPALRAETMFETIFGLARDGKTNARGMPNPLQMAVLARGADAYVGGVPKVVQDGLFGALAAVGKLLGYRDRYPQYSGTE